MILPRRSFLLTLSFQGDVRENSCVYETKHQVLTLHELCKGFLKLHIRMTMNGHASFKKPLHNSCSVSTWCLIL